MKKTYEYIRDNFEPFRKIGFGQVIFKEEENVIDIVGVNTSSLKITKEVFESLDKDKLARMQNHANPVLKLFADAYIKTYSKLTLSTTAMEHIKIPEVKKGEKDIFYSYSQRGVFLNNKRDYFFNYVFKLDENQKVSGIIPKKKSTALRFGSIFHELLEVYYTAIKYNFDKNTAKEIAKHKFELDERSKGNWELTADEEETVEAFKVFDHYCYYYRNQDFDQIIAVEPSFVSEIYSWPEHKLLKDYHFKQWIKVDLLVKDKGVYKLVEHKTHKQERDPMARISPQTLEYAHGLKKELGIEVKEVIFNEIRRAAPKGTKRLKSGKLSTSKAANSNLSSYELRRQLDANEIEHEDFENLMAIVNDEHYFKRYVFQVNENAQKQFLAEMRYATKSLAAQKVKEILVSQGKTEFNLAHYPINWNMNKRFKGSFDDVYAMIFQGMSMESVQDYLTDNFEPKNDHRVEEKSEKEIKEEIFRIQKEYNL